MTVDVNCRHSGWWYQKRFGICAPIWGFVAKHPPQNCTKPPKRRIELFFPNTPCSLTFPTLHCLDNTSLCWFLYIKHKVP